MSARWCSPPTTLSAIRRGPTALCKYSSRRAGNFNFIYLFSMLETQKIKKKEETAHFCFFYVHLFSTGKKFEYAKKKKLDVLFWVQHLQYFMDVCDFSPLCTYAWDATHFLKAENERHPDFLSPLFQTQPSQQHLHKCLRGSCQHQSQDAEQGQRRGEATSSSTWAWNACRMSLSTQWAQWLLLQAAFAVSGHKARSQIKSDVAKIALWNDSYKSGRGLHTQKPHYVHWHLASETVAPSFQRGEKSTSLGALGWCQWWGMEIAAQVISVHLTGLHGVAHFMLQRGAIIAPEETPASHPLPSCVPAPAPVCQRLSMSTTSCNVPALIFAGGLESSSATAFTPLLDSLILDMTGLALHRSWSRLILTTNGLKKASDFLWPVVSGELRFVCHIHSLLSAVKSLSFFHSCALFCGEQF